MSRSFMCSSPHASPPGHPEATQPGTSVLGWSAWVRVLAVLPVLALLWLAVGWACFQG